MTETIRTIMGEAFGPGKIALANRLGFLLGIIVLSLTWRRRACARNLLAYELACAGWSVLLLEKKQLPRDYTCGGGLTQRALKLIPFDVQDIAEDWAHSIRLRVNYRTTFAQTRRTPAVHLVMRDQFDHLLTQQAAAAGSVVQDRTRFLTLSGPPGNLTIQTSNGPFKTRVIVGADGTYSRVARALNLPIQYHIMPALEAELTIPPLTHKRFAGSIHFDFGVMPGGYAWLFPKKSHLSAGILARYRPAKQLKSHCLRNLENNGLSHARPISGRCGCIRSPAAPTAGIIMPTAAASS